MHVSAGPLRSVPEYAFPFSQQTEHIQKRAQLQPIGCPFMLTPDVWDSARFSSIFLDTKESKRQIPFEIEIDF